MKYPDLLAQQRVAQVAGHTFSRATIIAPEDLSITLLVG